jgi:hypothetical protein
MKKIMLLTISVMMLSMAAFAQRDTLKVREVGVVFSSLNSFGLCYKIGNKNTVFRITALSLSGGNNSVSYTNYTYDGVNYSFPSSPTNSYGAGLNIGIEKRSWINNKFYFYYGLALINAYSQSENTSNNPASSYMNYTNSSGADINQYTVVNNITTSNTWTFSSGIGVIIGVAYTLNRSFSIGAELIPSVTYSYTQANDAGYYTNVAWTGNSTTGFKPITYLDTQTFDKINKGVNFSVINTGAAITIAYRIK